MRRMADDNTQRATGPGAAARAAGSRRKWERHISVGAMAAGLRRASALAAGLGVSAAVLAGGTTPPATRATAGTASAVPARPSIAASASVPAPPGASASSQVFDIPAQPLATALEQFMTQTAHSGLYDSTLVRGWTSRPLRGTRVPEAALRELVADTGLTVRYTAPDVFTLTVPAGLPPRPAEPELEDPIQLRADYFAELQQEVHRALCRQFETAAPPRRFALSLWIGGGGRVTQVLLLDSSGTAARDARLTQRLREMRLTAPPPAAAIRQPVTLIVRPSEDAPDLGFCDD